MNVLQVDHIAVAVRSLSEAVELFVTTLGATFVAGGDDERLGIRTAQVSLAGTKIELIQPVRPDSYLQRYLDRHGEGFHHLTLFVDDLRDAIATLEAHGYQVVDTSDTEPTWRETFVRPKCAFGTLLQVVQTDRPWDRPFPGITLERVLGGEVVWQGGVPVLRT